MYIISEASKRIKLYFIVVNAFVYWTPKLEISFEEGNLPSQHKVMY